MRLVNHAIFHDTTRKLRLLFVANSLVIKREAVPYLFDQEDKLTSVFILWKQYLDNVFLVGKRRHGLIVATLTRFTRRPSKVDPYDPMIPRRHDNITRHI